MFQLHYTSPYNGIGLYEQIIERHLDNFSNLSYMSHSDAINKVINCNNNRKFSMKKATNCMLSDHRDGPVISCYLGECLMKRDKTTQR